MSEWSYTPLAELLAPGGNISYGIVQPGSHDDDGVPILRVSDIRNGRIDVTQPLRVSTSIESAHARTRLKGGELLLTLVGTVGETAVVPMELSGWNVARAVAVIPVHEDVGAYWLRLALSAPIAQEMIRGRQNTTVQATLNLKDVAQLPILMPAPDERAAIAKIIGDLDDKIELNRRMNETLEAMARAIFQSWFVDFDPVRAKASGESADSICQRLGLTPELLALFPDSFEDSELGDIPLGWGVASLEEFCELNAKSWSAKTLPDEVHYVDLANTKNGVIQEVQNLAKSEAPSRAKRVLRAGDTVIGTVRPGNRSFAFIGERDIQLTGSTGFAVLSPKEVYFAEFVYLVSTANDNIDRLTRLADGGAYPAVSPEVIVETTCVRPKTDVSMAFHEICGSLMTKFDANILSNIALTDVRNELLPKLLSGSLGLDGGEAL